MWISCIIFAVIYGLIISERMNRTAAALLGAMLVMMVGVLPYEDVGPFVDLDVVFLLAGMMIVVHILSETGLFEWIAIMIAQKAKGSGIRILIGLSLVTAVLSGFLDNVTTIVLIVPITILIAQILELPVVPFLILETLLSNIGGAATLVGDPPNILIGAHTQLTFNEFLFNLAPGVACVALLAMLIIFFRYRNRLDVPPAIRAQIMKAHPELAIRDARCLKIALPIFGAILIGFVMSGSLGWPPGIVALSGAVAMTVATGKDFNNAIEAIEWDAILFLVGLFILVGALEHNGLFDDLGGIVFAWVDGNYALAVIAMLWISGILAAVLGSVPIVLALIPLVEVLNSQFDVAMLGGVSPTTMWWALALGACLGGNGTYIGSAANIVTIQIARRNDYHIGFMEFARYGAPMTLFSLVIATFYLYVRYF